MVTALLIGFSLLIIAFLMGITVQFIRIESILNKISIVVEDRVKKMLNKLKQ
ncbi:MAG: hypothetical protein JW795_23345 [Chitinivibrionales bacterium]|nr:hypothetical protein [Chitinivibrionales bacterium]